MFNELLMTRRMFSILLITATIMLAIGAILPLLLAHAQDVSGNASIVVDQGTGQSVVGELTARVQDSWPWYLTRASGLVAGFVMIILMLSGIGFITGTTYAILDPITSWASHRALGIVLAVAVVVHMGSLYFDHFVPFGFGDLFIPFFSDYQSVDLFGVHVRSPYVALGVLSFYILLLVIVVALVWVERKTAKWKLIHILSYVAMVLVFFHALLLGTDLVAGSLFRTLWILLGAMVLTASLMRLWRAYTT